MLDWPAAAIFLNMFWAEPLSLFDKVIVPLYVIVPVPDKPLEPVTVTEVTVPVPEAAPISDKSLSLIHISEPTRPY